MIYQREIYIVPCCNDCRILLTVGLMGQKSRPRVDGILSFLVLIVDGWQPDSQYSEAPPTVPRGGIVISVSLPPGGGITPVTANIFTSFV